MAISRDTFLHFGGASGGALVSGSYTLTGNTLIVFFYHEDNANGVSVNWDGGSQGLTRVATTTNGIASHKVDVWVLQNAIPGTGTITCTPTGTVFREAFAVSYNGGATTGQPDGSDAPAGSTSSSSKSSNLTVTASNCWIVACGGDDNGVGSATGSGTVSKVASDSTGLGQILLDSNGTVSTGSQAYGFTGANLNGDCFLLGVSIAPSTSTATLATRKTLLGVGI